MAKLKSNNSSGFHINKVILIVIIIILIPLGLYFYNNKTNSVNTTTTTASWKTYTSTADKVRILYPQDWSMEATVQPSTPNYPHPEDLYFSKSLGGNKWFGLRVDLSIYGLGGSCPGYNSKTDILLTTPISVLNTQLIEIFERDHSGGTNNVASVHVLANTNAQCLNVDGVNINGLPGLFAAEMYYYEGTKDTISKISPIPLQEFRDSSEFMNAEKILQSLQFTR